MDAERFDRWIRSLVTTRSRRDVVAALGATASSLLGRSTVAAECPGLGVQNTCSTDGDCAGCGDAVCQARTCLRPTDGKCRRSSQCASGRCRRKKHKCRGCAVGTIPCGGGCVSSGGGDCEELSPDTCDGCRVSTCFGCACCGGGCSNTGGCDCRVDGASCAFNTQCCSTVCDSNQTCGCTAPDGGCVRHAQCCTRFCQANGRCAEPCADGRLPCGGVCCASGEQCSNTNACRCVQPLCDGICCPSGTSCQGNGLCVADPAP